MSCGCMTGVCMTSEDACLEAYECREAGEGERLTPRNVLLTALSASEIRCGSVAGGCGGGWQAWTYVAPCHGSEACSGSCPSRIMKTCCTPSWSMSSPESTKYPVGAGSSKLSSSSQGGRGATGSLPHRPSPSSVPVAGKLTLLLRSPPSVPADRRGQELRSPSSVPATLSRAK